MRWALLSFLCFIFQSVGAGAYKSSEFTIAQDSFISPDFDSTEKTNFQYLGISSKLVTEPASYFAAGLDVEAKLSSQSSLSYLNPRELYFGLQGGGVVSTMIGRKMYNWSFVDQIWKFGFYEPHFKWNPLFPSAQGLTGAFFNVGNSFLGFTLFATNVFIPDQGASFEISDGKFQRANPWLPILPNTAKIAGQDDDVGYVVHVPEVREVIDNPGYAARAYVGEVDQGLFAQGAIAVKPPNQLQLGFRPLLTAQNRIDLHVIPKVGRHHLSSADIGYGQKTWMLGISYLREAMDLIKFESDYTYQEYTPIEVGTAFIEIKPKSDAKIKMAVVKTSGGDSTVTGPYAAQSKDYLPGRLPFSEAGLVEAELKFRFSRRQNFAPKLSFIQGAANDFQILGIGATYSWNPNWNASIQGLLVKSDDSAEAIKSSAYQFENNDSVNMGLSYVF